MLWLPWGSQERQTLKLSNLQDSVHNAFSLLWTLSSLVLCPFLCQFIFFFLFFSLYILPSASSYNFVCPYHPDLGHFFTLLNFCLLVHFPFSIGWFWYNSSLYSNLDILLKIPISSFFCFHELARALFSTQPYFLLCPRAQCTYENSRVLGMFLCGGDIRSWTPQSPGASQCRHLVGILLYLPWDEDQGKYTATGLHDNPLAEGIGHIHGHEAFTMTTRDTCRSYVGEGHWGEDVEYSQRNNSPWMPWPYFQEIPFRDFDDPNLIVLFEKT